jgi:hypothetical protein
MVPFLETAIAIALPSLGGMPVAEAAIIAIGFALPCADCAT